jgi:hypothetical protein
MTDEYQVEVYGLTAEEWPRILAAVAKVGTFGHQVSRNGVLVHGGNPNKFSAGTAPSFSKTEKA